ncbi:hypothetical protein C8R45DRAFT_1039961 [Mycena sanguinolenta]|nr:hypothetical protein C8R45DRAFT_1039961 [Mycena sanguinolenta]
MVSHKNRCSKDGVLFTQYHTGIDISPVTDNDSFLLCVKRAEWDAMIDTERVSLWATGRDIFVYDITAGPKVTDIRARMTKNHYIDSVVQVQVQGLRVSAAGDDEHAEVDHTDTIRRTTLRAMLDHAHTPNGPVLNALNIASGPSKSTARNGFRLGNYGISADRNTARIQVPSLRGAVLGAAWPEPYSIALSCRHRDDVGVCCWARREILDPRTYPEP